MRPAYKITCNGNNITSALQGRLISLDITDEAGSESDKLSIKVADPNAQIALPLKGAEIAVSIGYKEQKLFTMGKYFLDNIKLAFPNDTLTINANAANMVKSLKENKTRSWDNITLLDMVRTIGHYHALVAKVDRQYADIYINHLDQTEESDLHFLTRVAKDHGAVVKPVESFLVFTEKGSGKNTSGKLMPAFTIVPGMISSGDVDLSERSQYARVRARYHDKSSGKTLYKSAGSGYPVYTIRNTYATPEQAQETANRKLQQFQRNTGKLSITIPGNPLIRAECTLILKGFRNGVNGTWIVKTAKHSISSGYKTTIEASAQ